MKQYTAFSADEITQLYSDRMLQQMDVLKDVRKGVIRTSLAVIWGALRDRKIFEEVLNKNGIERIVSDGPVCHDYIPEVISAARGRGSHAADGLAQYYNFVSACRKETQNIPGYDGLGWWQKISANVSIAKGAHFN